MIDYFEIAAKIALPQKEDDKRAFWLGAVYIRSDNKIVMSRNGESISTKNDRFISNPQYHCEGRVLRKGDHNGIMYIARVRRKDYKFGCAKPCQFCQPIIRSKSVEKVYYTIDNERYGIWHVARNIFDEKFFKIFPIR